MEPQTHFYGLNSNGLNGSDAPDSAVVMPPYPATSKPNAPSASRNETAAYEHPPFPRKRDTGDNRLPYFYAFSHPAVDDTPLHETALVRALSLVAAKMPGRAALLEHFYSNKLLVAYRRLCAVRVEEELKREQHNAVSEKRGKEIDAAQEEQARLRTAASLEERQKLDAAEQELAEAHRIAAAETARTGGIYDPENPSESAILRCTPKPLEIFAAEERLPFHPADEAALLPSGLSWVLTCLIGVMTGLSVGLMAHLLEADILLQKPAIALLCVLFGIASAIFGKYAVLLSFRHAAERYYLGRPVSAWCPFAAIGTTVALCLTSLDSVVERAGLLSIRGLENAVAGLSGKAAANDDGWIYLMGAILITFGYVVTAGWEGYVKGRFSAVANRLLARQHADFAEREQAERENPIVQEALKALALVRERRQIQQGIAARIGELDAPFAAKWAWLEAQRVGPQDTLTDTAKRRIEDASDDFRGCQGIFDRLLDNALTQCEPLYGWWERVIRAIWGQKAMARMDREHRSWRR